MMDRIEYEEWALKAIDPALAPKLTGSRSAAPAPQKGDAADAQGKQPREVVRLFSLSERLRVCVEFGIPPCRSNCCIRQVS